MFEEIDKTSKSGFYPPSIYHIPIMTNAPQ